ncbi:MAG: chorismate synthase [Proteobacteria bacterium]|nr:chorismate synthase [Pseudomonadota bacterium]
MVRFLTAGESHGIKLTVIIDGYPGGVKIDPSFINNELKRRMTGYGRGGRMSIEKDEVVFTSGIRFAETTGAPVTMEIINRDYANWEKIMYPFADKISDREVLKPRPGHTDLAGLLKYRRNDIRDILERSSARETAGRVAVGAMCKSFLELFKIRIYSFVLEIGGVGLNTKDMLNKLLKKEIDPEELFLNAEDNDIRIPADKNTIKKVREKIDLAKKEGDTLGGVFTVVAKGLFPGLGSHCQFDRKIDGILSGLLMSIPAVKAVSLGAGFFANATEGSEFHDEIFFNKKRGCYRKTNFAGGIEGGITNGEDIVFTVFMKPIPTLKKPLRSFNIKTMKPESASFERSDVSAVPACAVVAESMLAYGIMNEFLLKFGSDNINDITSSFNSYLDSINHLWKRYI